jgi:Ca-activated chloride channel homolog
MTNVEFADPIWFLALPVLAMLAFFYFKVDKKQIPTLKMPGIAAFRGAVPWRIRFRGVLYGLRLLSLVAIVVALARPRASLEPKMNTNEGIDIMLVMDLSSSMLAKDFTPDRLAVSKNVAIDFVEKRKNDRIGLVSFAGEAFTQCPLTSDHKIVQEMLRTLAIGRLADGTAIGMGLATAVNRLKDTSQHSKSQILILLTDGVNNAGYVLPEKAAELAQTLGIKIYTIGIGTMGDALSPVSRSADGEYIFGFTRVEIDENLMQKIADDTGGRYFRATTAEDLGEIYAQIDRLEKTKIDSETILRYRDLFGKWVALAIFLLATEIILRWTIFRSIT